MRWYDKSPLCSAVELLMWPVDKSLICIVEFALLAFAFRLEDSSKYRVAKLGSLSGDSKVAQTSIFKHVATWICAAYFLIYVGTEGALIR